MIGFSKKLVVLSLATVVLGIRMDDGNPNWDMTSSMYEHFAELDDHENNENRQDTTPQETITTSSSEVVADDNIQKGIISKSNFYFDAPLKVVLGLPNHLKQLKVTDSKTKRLTGFDKFVWQTVIGFLATNVFDSPYLYVNKDDRCIIVTKSSGEIQHFKEEDLDFKEGKPYIYEFNENNQFVGKAIAGNIHSWEKVFGSEENNKYARLYLSKWKNYKTNLNTVQLSLVTTIDAFRINVSVEQSIAATGTFHQNIFDGWVFHIAVTRDGSPVEVYSVYCPLRTTVDDCPGCTAYVNYDHTLLEPDCSKSDVEQFPTSKNKIYGIRKTVLL